jgi:hypothetical protein
MGKVTYIKKSRLLILVMLILSVCLGVLSRTGQFKNNGVETLQQINRPDGKGHRLIMPMSNDFADLQTPSEGDLSHEQYQRDIAELDNFCRDNDLDGLIKTADELEKKWRQGNAEYYGRLMLEIGNLIANDFSDDRAGALSQKYIFAALSKADNFSLELEAKLLPFLSIDISPKTTADDSMSAWEKDRRAKVKLWLHAWQRLEKEIDRNFDFNDLPLLNVMPPKETGLPAGIVPEAIKDIKLRLKYKAAISANAEKAQRFNHQFMLRQIDKSFPTIAESYIISAYSKPPFNTKELNEYLDIYLSDVNTKRRILRMVGENLGS